VVVQENLGKRLDVHGVLASVRGVVRAPTRGRSCP
jgi:hypothetical protein